MTVPKMFAVKIVPSSKPLPRDKTDVCRISAIIPYFAGTKNALWDPIRNTTELTRIELDIPTALPDTKRRPAACGSKKPSSPTAMIATSATFQPTTIERLLYLSARIPAKGENKKNG